MCWKAAFFLPNLELHLQTLNVLNSIHKTITQLQLLDKIIYLDSYVMKCNANRVCVCNYGCRLYLMTLFSEEFFDEFMPGKPQQCSIQSQLDLSKKRA